MTNDSSLSRTELDSHADSSCVGSNAVILSQTGRHIDVSAFVEELSTKNEVPIVTAAVAHADEDGNSSLLIINEALYFPSMKHNLFSHSLFQKKLPLVYLFGLLD